MNQLSQTLGPWGASHSYYDIFGNLKNYDVGGATGSYFYTSDNKLATFNDRAFSYDIYGNVAADGRRQYQYDDASSLVCVDCGTANEIDYVYDGNKSTRIADAEWCHYILRDRIQRRSAPGAHPFH